MFKDLAGTPIVRRNNFVSGDVTEGPMRWERARLNAEKNPDSKAAKLFKLRVRTGEAACAALGGDRSFPMVFTDVRYDHSGKQYSARKRYACSLMCGALQLQLARIEGDAVTDYLGSVLNGETVSLNDQARWREYTLAAIRLAPLQQVSCKTCGVKLQGDAATLRDIEKSTADHDQYVLIAGQFVRVADLRVVDLTAESHRLLHDYSTPELRAAYVADHGRRFDG